MSAPKFKVIIVDDDDIQLLYCKEVLLSMGHESITLSDGDSVIQKARDYNPDLILLDLQLPLNGKHDDNAGRKILNNLKSQKDLKHIPVVIISSVNCLADQLRCIISNHCEDFLVKPVKRELLEKKIKQNCQIGWINKEYIRVNEEYRKLKKNKSLIEHIISR